MQKNYNLTVFACFAGYITQAVVNNFIPLLFVTMQTSYDIPLAQITLLVTVNFGVQLLTDFAATYFVDKIGYRISIVAAHVLSAAGLLLLPVLPGIMDPFTGLLIPVIIYAVGGGLLEVLVSPIMESCPSDNKEAAMSLLHSFYCWGHVAVVLLSTAFFYFFGMENWPILSAIWALIPLANGILFTQVPIAPVIAEGETGMTFRELFHSRIFWILMVMMVCSGASEQAVSQWASTFAEQALDISKAAGDLAGPMAFAIFMGGARTFYGKFGETMNLDRFMKGSLVLCVASYLLISLSPLPVLSLVGCAMCGLSVGILWPGSFSKAAASLPRGGTAMFALLALAGDLGCSSGPSLVGWVADAAGGDLKMGILAAIVFPIVLLILCLPQKRPSRQ